MPSRVGIWMMHFDDHVFQGHTDGLGGQVLVEGWWRSHRRWPESAEDVIESSWLWVGEDDYLIGHRGGDIYEKSVWKLYSSLQSHLMALNFPHPRSQCVNHVLPFGVPRPPRLLHLLVIADDFFIDFPQELDLQDHLRDLGRHAHRNAPSTCPRMSSVLEPPLKYYSRKLGACS